MCDADSRFEAFPKQSVYSSSLVLFLYGLYKQKSILEKPLGTNNSKADIPYKYFVQSIKKIIPLL